MGPLRAVGIGLLAALGGCAEPLPACDIDAAREVVFLDAPSDVTGDDGVPMYAGQALLHASCGGHAYCHAAEAQGVFREGVPKGLDFDLGVPCVDLACSPEDEALAAFEAHLVYVRRHAEDLFHEVHRGRMPPDGVGARVATRAGTIRRAPAEEGALADAEPLPMLDTHEGRAIFANWLACDAPVVATAARPDVTHAPGDACSSSADAAGDCVTRLVETSPPLPVCATPAPTGCPTAPDCPVPTWEGLYARVFAPLCADACHGSTSPRIDDPRFGTMAETYEALLDQDTDEPLVIPGHAADSHVVHHIEGLYGFEVMPVGLLSGELPDEVQAAIRTWIDAGALETCP